MTAALFATGARTFRSLRKHRNYRLFFAGQIVSASGSWMQNVALAWLVFELTGSPVAVGAMIFFRFAPATLLGLFAGVLADRVDNRRLVMATQAFSMLVALALAGLVFGGLAEVWHLYVLAAVAGTAQALDSPGRHALTFQLVGRDELPNAVALNTSLFNASRIIGPGIGGFVIAGAGVGWCFALNALSFVAVLVSLALMDARELHPLDRASERPTFLRGAREGLGYAARSRRVRLVLLIVAVVSTVGVNNSVILPVLAADTLHAGPEVFGILSACFGAGALTGALLSAGIARASWQVLTAGTGGFGLAMLAIAPQSTVAACAALLFAAGVSFTLWTSNANTLLQLGAPDHMRGRVISLYLFAFHGLAPPGALLVGWLVAVGGTGLAFTVAGASALAMTAIAFVGRPRPQLLG